MIVGTIQRAEIIAAFEEAIEQERGKLEVGEEGAERTRGRIEAYRKLIAKFTPVDPEQRIGSDPAYGFGRPSIAGGY